MQGWQVTARIAASYGRIATSPRYFPLWLAQVLSSFGDSIHYIALVVLVFELTGEGVAVAALVVAELVPAIALGSVAGVVIDRWNRKWVLIGSDLARAALAFSLVWPQGAWHAYVVAAGLAAGNAFFNPTVQAVIPSLTTEQERLAANSVAWTSARIMQIVASAVAGGLIAMTGTGPAFVLNGASFVASALLITRLDISRRDARREPGSSRGFGRYIDDVRLGLRFAARDHFVSRIVPIQALASLSIGATSALLIVLADRHMRLTPADFAWLIGAIGIGSLVGPLVVSAFAGDYRDARWLFIPYIIRGVGDLLLATLAPFPIALLLMVSHGLCASAGSIVFGSVLQRDVPDAVRGRVYTLLNSSWNASRLVSLAAGGLVADQYGVQVVYLAAGALLIAAGGLGLITLGRRPLGSDGHDRTDSDSRLNSGQRVVTPPPVR